MNVDDSVGKDLTELIGHHQDGNKRVKGKIVAKEQDSTNENELIINGIAEHVKERNEGGVQARFVVQVPLQQPQGATVCWERFLHLRSLKVLLVEKDNSTRQVVAALLRNCSYDVIETANGFQAWRIIEDLSYHIDLVLTEVAIPFHSGTALLSKIMNHKTRHNVPVIMMSSHDSMGLVFKCLSKGAVDFLVKPIRKNELRNLWQHVWRRCHSSSGSGSGSGAETQKSVKLKSFEKSDNNTGSNDEYGNGSIGLNAGDGSDDESGAQSSWTQQVVEAESPRLTAPQDRIGEYPDSICAQVIHSNADTFVIKQVPMTLTRVCQEQEKLDNVSRGKDLEIGTPGGLNLQLQYPNEVAQKNVLEMDPNQFCEHLDISKLNCETPNLADVITDRTNPQMDSTGLEAPNRLLKIYDTNNEAISASKELPSLELSLKRARGVEDIEITVQDETFRLFSHVLRHSDSSAFSRYNTTSNTKKCPSGNLGKSVPHGNSLGILIKEPVQNIQSHSNGDPPNQFSDRGSNYIDMGSTSYSAFNNPLLMKNKSAAASSIKCLSLSSAFQPLKHGLLCSAQQVKLDKSGHVAATTLLAQPRDLHGKVQIPHLRHYNHHLVHSMQEPQLPYDYNDSLKKMPTKFPHCGSSNVLGGMLESDVGNSSFHGSASGSNYGSNGQNESNTAVNAGAMNVESDNGIARKGGSGDASVSGSGNIVENKFERREAALAKFRQKRKERCFRKKVRYQSRKKLAEQRPRVRGQFVRQKQNENTNQPSDA